LSDYAIPKAWRDSLSVLEFLKEGDSDTDAAHGSKVLTGQSLTWLDTDWAFLPNKK